MKTRNIPDAINVEPRASFTGLSVHANANRALHVLGGKAANRKFAQVQLAANEIQL